MPFIIGFGNIVAQDDCNGRFSGTLEQKQNRSIVPDRLAVLFGVKCSCFAFEYRFTEYDEIRSDARSGDILKAMLLSWLGDSADSVGPIGFPAPVSPICMLCKRDFLGC